MRLGVWRVLICTVMICLVGSIAAVKVSAEGLPAHLTCAFTKGSSGSYEDGAFTSGTPEALQFELKGIDLEKQSAQLVAKDEKKAGGLRIVRAVNANHFLEVVNEGFLNLTTVYDEDGKTGDFPAVHSRHFGLLGQPFFAQYTGKCRVK